MINSSQIPNLFSDCLGFCKIQKSLTTTGRIEFVEKEMLGCFWFFLDCTKQQLWKANLDDHSSHWEIWAEVGACPVKIPRDLHMPFFCILCAENKVAVSGILTCERTARRTFALSQGPLLRLQIRAKMRMAVSRALQAARSVHNKVSCITLCNNLPPANTRMLRREIPGCVLNVHRLCFAVFLENASSRIILDLRERAV